MLIDWFTVGAQIVNFLVLVWLLRRFLYRPIIQAMQERERSIALRLKEAAEARQVAAQEAASYRDRSQQFERDRKALLEQAAREAEEHHAELVQQAREEANRLRDEWLKAVERDRSSLLLELRDRTARAACSATRRALAEIADVELERQIMITFSKRLKELDAAAAERLRQAIGTDPDGLVVRSAFDIAEPDRERLSAALELVLGSDLRIRWETGSLPGCGIEISTDGQKVAWSFADFTVDLEHDIGLFLAQANGPSGGDHEQQG